MSRTNALWCVCVVAALSMGNAFAAEVSPTEKETIAIIGTGDLGDSFGARLAALGYPFVYGSRTPDSYK
jgi:lactate dehydrogenase-like 2-hydroxyacid dehydrogenase